MKEFAAVQRIDGLQFTNSAVQLPMAIAVVVDQLGEFIQAVNVQPFPESVVIRSEHVSFGATLSQFFSLGNRIDRELCVLSDESQFSAGILIDTPVHNSDFGDSAQPDQFVFDADEVEKMFASLHKSESIECENRPVGLEVEIGESVQCEVQVVKSFAWVRTTPFTVKSLEADADVLTRLPVVGDLVSTDFIEEKEECLGRIERLDDLVGVFRRFQILISQISKRIEVIESMVDRVIGRSLGQSGVGSPSQNRVKALLAIDSLIQLSDDSRLIKKLFGKSIKMVDSDFDIAKIFNQFSSLEANISELKSVILLIKDVEYADIPKLTSANFDKVKEWLENQFDPESIGRFITDIQAHMGNLMSHVKQSDGRIDSHYQNRNFTTVFFENLKQKVDSNVGNVGI